MFTFIVKPSSMILSFPSTHMSSSESLSSILAKYASCGTKQSLQHRRLSIPADLYNTAPTRAIKQILSPSITIHSHQPQSIITSDDTVIVDVTFSALTFSFIDIYYIPTAALKHVIPESSYYVANVNGVPVKITNPPTEKFPHVIPVRIKTTLPNNYSPNGQEAQQFAYYATVVTAPLSSYISIVKNPMHAIASFTIDLPTICYPSSFPEQFNITHFKSTKSSSSLSKSHSASPVTDSSTTMTPDELSLQSYQTYYASISDMLPLIDHIKYVDMIDFDSVPMTTTAYIIPYTSLPIDKPLSGIIVIHKQRFPTHIMVFPTRAFTITPDELKSIRSLLEADYINYYNYQYLLTLSSQKE